MGLKTLGAKLHRRKPRPIMSGAGETTGAGCPPLQEIRVFAHGDALAGTATMPGADRDTAIAYRVSGSVDQEGRVTLLFQPDDALAHPHARTLKFSGPRDARAFTLMEDGPCRRALRMKRHERRGVSIGIELGFSDGDGGGDGGGGK